MILEKVCDPQDIKKLTSAELVILAAEVRQRIVDVVSHTGGHLASSLGAVELIIALHYCLDMKRDALVFDVGHQSYAHKILTGRNARFDTLRQYGGISGFPLKDESLYDIFTSGHSSNAVSLSLGLACARDIALAEKDRFKVVSLIGDGSLSGGLCLAGLNNAGHLKKDMWVVLNTNEHSIAPNVGAISNYLNKLISLPLYNRFKNSLEHFIDNRMPKGSRIIKLANKFEESLKGLFIPGMLFEELGFRYFGPFDGHNLELLIQTFKKIMPIKGPLLLHVVTKKGKGYLPAENEPVRFHGTGPFDIATGLPRSGKAAALPTYTEVFSRTMVDLAKENKSIVAITAAMPEGTGLDKFRDAYPDRFFDVGISEEHAACFASGLSKRGLRPVVAVYSTFLQRAYDQIIEDVALQDSPVVFAIDRAGIVGEDGVTHQGVFDIAYLRTIPQLVMMAPKDGAELEAMLKFSLAQQACVALRYPKGTAAQSALATAPLLLGKAEVLQEGDAFALIALGSMVAIASEAARILEKAGYKGTVVNARFVKPLDEQLYKTLSARMKMFTIEEGVVAGGFGSAVSEAIAAPVTRLGLPSEFITHGTREVLLKKYGLTASGIAETIKRSL